MKIVEFRRNPRLRKFATRLLLPVTVLTACFSTLDSWPIPGKHWRPVLIAQIGATWLAVAVSAWAGWRNQRKERELAAHKAATLAPVRNADANA